MSCPYCVDGRCTKVCEENGKKKKKKGKDKKKKKSSKNKGKK